MQEQLEQQVQELAHQLVRQAHFREGDVFVLGCSTSEIVGGSIGKASNAAIGQRVVKALYQLIGNYQLHLAVQCCEHLNRALVVERQVAFEKGYEIVQVVPALHAGGACAVAAYEQFIDPVLVEHIEANMGLDIGDTAIGMHVKHVQVPCRLTIRQIGNAHVTSLYSRPKLIGGARAQYA